MQIALAEAKSHFAELIRKVEQGEDVVLTRYGKAVARIVSAEPAPKPNVLGYLKGRVSVADDFDDPLPDDLQAAFEGSLDPS